MVRNFILAIFFILAAAVPVSAEEPPTDPYTGKVITWDLHGNGGEEIGGGTSEESEREQSTERIEDSAEERVKILKIMYENESAAEHVPAACRIRIPDYEAFEWSQSNVRVILRGSSGNVTFDLYRQEGFEAKGQMDAGRYVLVSAKAVDGSMKFRTEDPWIDITEVGENLILLRPSSGNITVKEIEISPDLETVPETVNSDTESGKNSIIFVLLIAVSALLLTVILIAAVVIVRKKNNRYS